jgi:uncharacterized OB-fold protein
MIKSKKEWICNKCGATHLTWQGYCKNCNAAGTLQEKILVATTRTRSTADIKRVNRRAKNSEREIARSMITVDGVDPAFAHITSSTGRVGHITGLRFDAISKNYVTENKNRNLPLWLINAWLLINQKAVEYNKNALLHLEPPNAPKYIPIQGRQVRLDSMAVITKARHDDLIRAERALHELLNDLSIGTKANQKHIDKALNTLRE